MKPGEQGGVVFTYNLVCSIASGCGIGCATACRLARDGHAVSIAEIPTAQGRANDVSLFARLLLVLVLCVLLPVDSWACYCL